MKGKSRANRLRPMLLCLALLALPAAAHPESGPFEKAKTLMDQGDYDGVIAFARGVLSYYDTFAYDARHYPPVYVAKSGEWAYADQMTYNRITGAYWIGRAYLKKMDFKQALDAFGSAERLFPSLETTPALFRDLRESIGAGLCEALIGLSRFDEAMQKAKASLPEGKGSRGYYLGYCLLAKGKAADALPYLNDSIAKDSRYYSSYRTRAFAFKALGDFTAAINDATVLLNAFPGELESLSLRASCFAAIESYEKALADLGAILKVRGGDRGARYLRGQIYALDAKSYPAALDDVTVLIQDCLAYPAARPSSFALPSLPDLFLVRGMIKARSGDYASAVADLDAVCEMAGDPNELSAYFFRALCMEKLGRKSEALADYAKVAALDPAGASLTAQEAAKRVEALKKAATPLPRKAATPLPPKAETAPPPPPAVNPAP